MNLLSNAIESISVKKVAVATLFFMLMIYVIDFSPIGVAGLTKITGGPSILDFEHGYSVEKAYGMLEALGEEGRSFYLTKILPEDIFFPLSFMLFNFCWICILIKKLTKAGSIFRYIVFLPVVNMLMDWSENIGFLLMLLHYPEQLVSVCKISSLFTHLKFTCVLLIIITFGMLITLSIIKSIVGLVKSKAGKSDENN